jgi:hypothetical protein
LDGSADSPEESAPSGLPSPSGVGDLALLDDSPFAPYLPAIAELTSLPPQTAQEEAAIKARSDSLGEFIAQCMHDRGFEYFDAPWEVEREESVVFFPDGVDLIAVGTLPDEIDQVRRTGYGLVAPAGGVEIIEDNSPEAQANEDYRASLSAAAQAAYDLALNGQDFFEEPDSSIPAGCGALAIEAFPEVQATELSVYRQFWLEFGPLVLEMNQLVFDGVFQDQRLRSLSLDWYDCMVKAGYDQLTAGWHYTTDNINLNAGFDLALATKLDGQAGPSWYSVDGLIQIPDEERSLVGSPPEIAIAVADFECRQPLDYFDTHKAVQFELEQQFVDANSAALEGILDFYERYKTGDYDQ